MPFDRLILHCDFSLHPTAQEIQVQSLEKGMATHSSILAWRIPRIEEPGMDSPRGRRELDMTHT